MIGRYRRGYHKEQKQRIKNGELIGYGYSCNSGDGEYLVLQFSTAPFSCYVRPHSYWIYDTLLADWKRSRKEGVKHDT